MPLASLPSDLARSILIMGICITAIGKCETRSSVAVTDKQMQELLEAFRLKESPDQLRFDLFAGKWLLPEDGCGQLLLFG